MKLQIRIDMGDGPYVVRTSLMDIVGWERKYKRKVSTIDTQGIGAEDIAYLGFLATKSAGMTTPLVFEDFLQKIVDIEVVDEGDDMGPTEADSATS